jgi:hypothetical protein
MAMAAFALAVIGTAADGWPPPLVDDEFGLLLGGQTLALGRLSNPAHPLPDFFATFHVLQEPTYAAKYFPGQALFLGIGIALAGSARFGHWLAFACMGATLVWMLKAWVPRRIAIAVSAAALLVFADTAWASGYWGSSLSVASAALVMGSLRRLFVHARVTTALLLGVGVSGLALTRPWEGLWLALPCGVAFWYWVLSAPGADRRRRLRRAALPTSLMVMAGAAFIALHNRAVTGSWRTAPYVLYEASASGAPPFVWQTPRAPNPIARVTERLRYASDMAHYERARGNPFGAMRDRAAMSIAYFGGGVVACTLLLVLFAPRRAALALPAASVLLVAAAIATSSYYTPHYLGPIFPPLLVLMAAGAASLAAAGRVPRAMAVAGFVVVLFAGVSALTRKSALETVHGSPSFWAQRRAAVQRELDRIPGKHLIFVRYGPRYAARFEWVHNDADLAQARVLWAHDLGERNAELLSMDPERRAWLLELDAPDGAVPSLKPY